MGSNKYEMLANTLNYDLIKFHAKTLSIQLDKIWEDETLVGGFLELLRPDPTLIT